jgi:DEAD/DEAH box helicase
LVVQSLQVLRKLATCTDVTSTGTNEVLPGRRQPPITQHVVIGTQGTLKKLIASRLLRLEAIKVFVFDEADHMVMTEGMRLSKLGICQRKEIESCACRPPRMSIFKCACFACRLQGNFISDDIQPAHGRT